ncbi:unnamed protein product [Rhizoctonia solani]|uniref:Uncharacterized protein n=1 Tax=Rhizoctonia solani TaxID=456999 RepID=A0A8H3DQ09_9AGAM|nr:unnamed protein product [Rhizoctonia solani]
MSRSKAQILLGILITATWIQTTIAYKLNATIHDTDLGHITYSDASIKCNRWLTGWLSQSVCESWLKPWTSGVYRSGGKIATFHSSLNHQLASVTIEFQGTDVWVYGPPLSELREVPPDYKICLYESYRLSSAQYCYNTNVTAAYSASNHDQPAVVFARGRLANNQHRIVISVADPVNELTYNGIKFSHVVYTTERPTPWPVEEDRWRYREVVMHDTHPMLSYSPIPSKWEFWRWSPWSARLHTSEDGATTSWHEFNSNEEGYVETKIKAGAIAVYGAPSAYIENRDRLGFACVQLDLGACETIDLKTIYANQKDLVRHEPVLLWRNDALDPSHQTRVSIRSAKTFTGIATIFPFKSIHYREEQEYSSPKPLVGDSKNVTIEHDNYAISYNPGRRCESHGVFGGCSSWFDPWRWREAGPLGSVLTYRSTISKYRVKEDPHITLSFSGSAVYLYGAPTAYAARPFAPQHVCINNACRLIDVEQAYLHPPRRDMESASVDVPQSQSSTAQNITTSMSIPHPELEPVLIWSTTGLNDKLEHTLRLALASLPAPENAEMSIVKIVYTRVTYGRGEYPPKPPAPGQDRAYAGPLKPPYSTNWVPLAHKPLPPISTDLPLHGQSPFLLVFAFVLLQNMGNCATLGPSPKSTGALGAHLAPIQSRYFYRSKP